MVLACFVNPPMTSNQMGENDYFTGDAETKSFTLVKNTYASLGNTVQADNLFYLRSDKTVTGSGSTMNLSSAPPEGAAIIAPNVNYGILGAYDHAPYPQTAEDAFAVGDIANIETRTYGAAPGESGIKLYMTNRLGTGGADPSWFEFAPMNDDRTIGTYQAAGDPLILTHEIKAASVVSVIAVAGTKVVIVEDASDFVAGQWIKIKDGSNTDISWVVSVVGNTLNLADNLTYGHAIGVQVYACCTGFALRVTIPDDVAGGFPVNLFNCSLDVLYRADAR